MTRKKADKRAWNFLQQIVLVLGVGNSSCWVFICETCPWFRSMELWFKSMTRNGSHTPAEKYKPTHPEPENEKFCFGNVSKMKHTKFSRGWLLDIWLFRGPLAHLPNPSPRPPGAVENNFTTSFNLPSTPSPHNLSPLIGQRFDHFPKISRTKYV